VIRRRRIDPIAARQLSAPELVIPIAVSNPGARRPGACEVTNSFRKFVRRARVAKLHGRKTESADQKVNVRVDESGNHQLSARIDHADIAGGRSNALHDFGARANGSDAIAAGQEGVGPPAAIVARPDVGVNDGNGFGRGGHRNRVVA
jgi:hypothetical protein